MVSDNIPERSGSFEIKDCLYCEVPAEEGSPLQKVSAHLATTCPSESLLNDLLQC